MPLVHLKTARLEYKFEINGKYTIIKGDSGTGKTTLYELAELMSINPKAVQNISRTKISAVPLNADVNSLTSYQGYVLIIDEECTLLSRHDIASILQNSENYFIIITRERNLAYLPIHVDNVFRMKSSGKFHTLDRIYERFKTPDFQDIDTIITEDMQSFN